MVAGTGDRRLWGPACPPFAAALEDACRGRMAGTAFFGGPGRRGRGSDRSWPLLSSSGERLVPNSLYSCIFAELLIDRLGTKAQKQEYLQSMIAGASLATIAYSEPHAAEQPRLFRTTATRAGHEWVLSGVKAFVPDVETADVLFVLANARSNSDQRGLGPVRRPRGTRSRGLAYAGRARSAARRSTRSD